MSIAGGSDLGLFEINEAARLVSEAAHPDANIIFGTVIDDTLGDEVRVTVIAAGFDGGLPTTRETAEVRVPESETVSVRPTARPQGAVAQPVGGVLPWSRSARCSTTPTMTASTSPTS